MRFRLPAPVAVPPVDESPLAPGDPISHVGGSGGTLRRFEGAVTAVEWVAYDTTTGITRSGLLACNSPIRPGDSGGPVFRRGRLVGLSQGCDIEVKARRYFVPIVGRFKPSRWR